MRIRTIAIAGLAGVAVAYLFDPIAGTARRRRLRERIVVVTRLRPKPEKTEPLPVNEVPAPTMEAATDTPPELPSSISSRPPEHLRGDVADPRKDRPMDDDAIASLVRTKVRGRTDLDTGSLVVDVVRGVAFLRGDLKDRRQIDEVVDLTGAVPGVQEVQNLIHLPASSAESRETATRLGDAWNA